MNLDLKCLSAGLVLLVIIGVSWAVPVELYEPEGWQQDGTQEQEAVKRYPAKDWTNPAALPHRETRRRKNMKSWIVTKDDSIKTYLSKVRDCDKDQVCKQAEKSIFNCPCPVNNFCVADGRQYEATCRNSKVGLYFIQPK